MKKPLGLEQGGGTKGYPAVGWYDDLNSCMGHTSSHLYENNLSH